MRTLSVSIAATLGGALVVAAALLWPKAPAEAQVGLPVGVADCSCTKGTQLETGGSRVFVHICQCGSMQCVITAGTTGTGSAVPQLAQTCR